MRRGALLVLALTLVAAAAPAGARQQAIPGEVELAGVFHAGGTIRGAAIHSGYLYVSTPDRLAIYDLEDPENPQRRSMVASPRLVHGELLSTNGELLITNEQNLVNDNFGLRTVDIWDVEDKSNPKLVGTVPSVPDEHLTCVLDCTWAYGSEGTILDLRDPTEPKKLEVNWMELAGLSGSLHRVDEFRPGFIATAPSGWQPVTYDVRDPLRPRVHEQTRYPSFGRTGFLFTNWANEGRSRYLFSSVEYPSDRDCDDKHDGALLAFDMRKRPAPLVSRFSVPSRNGCVGFYFSFHPDFERTRLIALPQSLGGVRIVEFQPGKMIDAASFVPVVADVWLTFWIDEEFFYALSTSGEVYILRYVP